MQTIQSIGILLCLGFLAVTTLAPTNITMKFGIYAEMNKLTFEQKVHRLLHMRRDSLYQALSEATELVEAQGRGEFGEEWHAREVKMIKIALAEKLQFHDYLHFSHFLPLNSNQYAKAKAIIMKTKTPPDSLRRRVQLKKMILLMSEGKFEKGLVKKVFSLAEQFPRDEWDDLRRLNERFGAKYLADIYISQHFKSLDGESITNRRYAEIFKIAQSQSHKYTTMSQGVGYFNPYRWKIIQHCLERMNEVHISPARKDQLEEILGEKVDI